MFIAIAVFFFVVPLLLLLYALATQFSTEDDAVEGATSIDSSEAAARLL